MPKQRAFHIMLLHLDCGVMLFLLVPIKFQTVHVNELLMHVDFQLMHVKFGLTPVKIILTPVNRKPFLSTAENCTFHGLYKRSDSLLRNTFECTKRKSLPRQPGQALHYLLDIRCWVYCVRACAVPSSNMDFEVKVRTG